MNSNPPGGAFDSEQQCAIQQAKAEAGRIFRPRWAVGWTDAELFQIAADAHIEDSALYQNQDWADSLDPQLITRRNSVQAQSRAAFKTSAPIRRNPPCPQCGGKAKFICAKDSQIDNFQCRKCNHRFEGQKGNW